MLFIDVPENMVNGRERVEW